MLPIPKKFFVTAGSAEGSRPLNAFDNALLKSRIGNINLIKVSSILPPGVEFSPDLQIPPGALVPTAYGHIISEVPGEIISAAVGVGFSRESHGVIMEFSGKCGKVQAENTIRNMVEEAFELRDMELLDVKIAATEHQVESIGCALAAVPLWY